MYYINWKLSHISLILLSLVYYQNLPSFNKITWVYTYKEDQEIIKARDLCSSNMYDEALIILNNIKLDKTSDPAGFLFYKSVCEYVLLMQKECISSINLLLEQEDEIPIRYSVVAKLMLNDIKQLKVDSLDEITRLMSDINRRLDLGRVGKIVRNQEQLVIDKLDKLIKKTEDDITNTQAQTQEKGKIVPKDKGTPMKDGEIANENGPGDIDQKNLYNGENWGNLPPKQRQESIQRLVEQLPSHYREIIEAYFRKLAKDNKS